MRGSFWWIQCHKWHAQCGWCAGQCGWDMMFMKVGLQHSVVCHFPIECQLVSNQVRNSDPFILQVVYGSSEPLHCQRQPTPLMGSDCGRHESRRGPSLLNAPTQRGWT